MKSISFIEANKDFKAVLDKMNEVDVICINRDEAADTVVMSLAHYSSLMETLHLLGSSANAAHLAKSIEQYQAGDVKKRMLKH